MEVYLVVLSIGQVVISSILRFYISAGGELGFAMGVWCCEGCQLCADALGDHHLPERKRILNTHCEIFKPINANVI